MHRADNSGCRIRDEDWRTIGHSNADGRLRIAADDDVGFRPPPPSAGVRSPYGYCGAMHLADQQEPVA